MRLTAQSARTGRLASSLCKAVTATASRLSLAIGFMLCLASSLYAQVMLNPVNGHFYERITSSTTWPQALDLASMRTHQGLQGYLATITDRTENDFIVSLGGTDNHFLGGFQDITAPDYSEPTNGWRWITGEAWDFTSWAPGEPNNNNNPPNPFEEFLHFSQGPGNWNDVSDDYVGGGYIVEYGLTASAAPEPGTVALIALGLVLGAAGAVRRRLF